MDQPINPQVTTTHSSRSPRTNSCYHVKLASRTHCIHEQLQASPTNLATMSPIAAERSGPYVEQLLAAGAACEGKTISDEVAFSLLGENVFYGTPLNPAAPERVPGGSSSGSASVVASGLV